MLLVLVPIFECPLPLLGLLLPPALVLLSAPALLLKPFTVRVDLVLLAHLLLAPYLIEYRLLPVLLLPQQLLPLLHLPPHVLDLQPSTLLHPLREQLLRPLPLVLQLPVGRLLPLLGLQGRLGPTRLLLPLQGRALIGEGLLEGTQVRVDGMQLLLT
jgi:hypothetical protein